MLIDPSNLEVLMWSTPTAGGLPNQRRYARPVPSVNRDSCPVGIGLWDRPHLGPGRAGSVEALQCSGAEPGLSVAEKERFVPAQRLATR